MNAKKWNSLGTWPAAFSSNAVALSWARAQLAANSVTPHRASVVNALRRGLPLVIHCMARFIDAVISLLFLLNTGWVAQRLQDRRRIAKRKIQRFPRRATVRFTRNSLSTNGRGEMIPTAITCILRGAPRLCARLGRPIRECGWDGGPIRV